MRESKSVNRSWRAYLMANHNPGGGWGYAPGEASCVEPTAAATLALRDDPPSSEVYLEALAWLRAAQHRDGGWGVGDGDEVGGWQTAWGLLALGKSGDIADAVAGGVEWLLRVERAGPDADSLEVSRQVLEIDAALRGWPWLPGEATWVEPTALAMMALGAVPRTSEINARLDESARYLSDRRCRGGGWNVGNPVMFSQALPPRACPTAWALLALADVDRDAIRGEDLEALRSDMESDGGALALGWGLLALRTLGQGDADTPERLAALQGADGSWNGNPYHTAIAGIASRGSL
jgi:hypothetical protein